MIVEYSGEVIRQPVGDKREKEYEKTGASTCYLFRLDKDWIVDATTQGCCARFINHSCDVREHLHPQPCFVSCSPGPYCVLVDVVASR